jgi:IBR domain, a half RING-finger domain
LSSWPYNRATCWAPSCNATLDYGEIQRFAARNTFDRYDQFLLHQAMEGSDSTYKRCASSGCNGGGWYDPATTSFIICQSCQQRTCVDCDTTPYHSGQLCPNSPQGKRMRQEDDDATAALVERISKPCPNEKCGARIEKNEGCDHMTCMCLASLRPHSSILTHSSISTGKKCRHEFCWLCLEPYGPIRTYGNSRHARGCTYRTP